MEIKSAKRITIWENISWSRDRVKSQEQFALNFNSPIELHVHGIAKVESNLNRAHTWLSKVELMAYGGVIMEALFYNWKRILISRQRGFGG